MVDWFIFAKLQKKKKNLQHLTMIYKKKANPKTKSRSIKVKMKGKLKCYNEMTAKRKYIEMHSISNILKR